MRDQQLLRAPEVQSYLEYLPSRQRVDEGGLQDGMDKVKTRVVDLEKSLADLHGLHGQLSKKMGKLKK
jgi:hypothetical protein